MDRALGSAKQRVYPDQHLQDQQDQGDGRGHGHHPRYRQRRAVEPTHSNPSHLRHHGRHLEKIELGEETTRVYVSARNDTGYLARFYASFGSL